MGDTIAVELGEKERRAVEKAALILSEHMVRDELEAYWLLVRHEKEIGYPVTYDLVLEALKIAEEIRRGKAEEKVAVHA